MGFTPAPTPAGKLGWEGQTALTVPKTGLAMVPGAGVIGRTDVTGKRLQFDSPRVTPPETASFFLPGAVSAYDGATVCLWDNQRANRLSRLSALSVDCLTAPTAGDAANKWNVSVTDGVGTPVLLPISTIGVAHYNLSRGDEVEIARKNVGLPVSGTSNTNGGTEDGVRGFARELTITQPLTITGCSWAGQVRVPGWDANPAGQTARMIRCQILDNTLTPIGPAAYASTQSAVQCSQLGFAFPLSMTLAAGTYWLAIDGFATIPDGSAFGLGWNESLAGRATEGHTGTQASPIVLGPRMLRVIAGAGGYVPWRVPLGCAGFDWPAFYNAAKDGEPYRHVFATALGDTGYSTYLGWDVALLGSPAGAAALVGNLTFKIEKSGVPVAGAAGSNLNVRAVILP